MSSRDEGANGARLATANAIGLGGQLSASQPELARDRGLTQVIRGRRD